MRAALWLLTLAATLAQRNKPQGVQLTSSPYDILGVHRRATVQEIRNAYRAKARETHPDKARPGREAEMRDRFLEVAAAFELLTDENARRDFDSRGTYQRPTTKTYKRRTQKKHTPLTEEEERAAARVLNVRSRKHLEDAALGEDGKVDRHFVLALYDEGECEDYLTFITRFPYPFADKLDPHGIWWEDVRCGVVRGAFVEVSRRWRGGGDSRPPKRVASHVLPSSRSRRWRRGGTPSTRRSVRRSSRRRRRASRTRTANYRES